MTRAARKRCYSLFPGQSSGWVARGSVQTLSQMNGCHVPGNRGHTEPGLQANWQNSPFSFFRVKRLNSNAECAAVAQITFTAIRAEKVTENSGF
jgi:hypothetical protein